MNLERQYNEKGREGGREGGLASMVIVKTGDVAGKRTDMTGLGPYVAIRYQ